MTDKIDIPTLVDLQDQASMLAGQLTSQCAPQVATPLENCVVHRCLTLVRFKDGSIQAQYLSNGNESKHHYILFGEIAQMTGHVVLMNCRNSNLLVGIHTEELEVIPQDEC